MKFNEFPALTELNDDDLLLVWDDSASALKTVTLANFKSFIGSPAAETLPTLTWSSNGDANGMCFWLATRGNSGGGWSNPHVNGKLIVSSGAVAAGNVANIVDRQGGVSNYTANSANNYWMVDFLTHKLKPNYYSIRKDANSGYTPTNWTLQGSNDGTNFTTLDTQSGNTALDAPNSWVSIPLSAITTAYRYLAVVISSQNTAGTYEFCCGELEFYGEVVAL